MKIGLLGHGVVGSGVTKIIDGKSIRGLEVKRILVKEEREMTDPRCTMDVNEILNDPEIDIIAECMGGIEPARTFVMTALKNGKHAVTSNKKMLASDFAGLMETAVNNRVQLRYEASVGGGIPWIHEIERTSRIDEIRSFSGIFNGTTNYILDRMTREGLEFDEMLKEAQKLGYAERDPSDDIDAQDVRYKCCITAGTAFHVLMDPAEIITFGIRHITKEDIDAAKAMGRTCKLIGNGVREENGCAVYVMPAFLKNCDLRASVGLNYNICETVSDTLGTAAYYGQGAGSLPTAHAVVQDLADLAEGHAPVCGYEEAVNDCAEVKSRYYIRTCAADMFEDMIDEKLNANAFVTKVTALNEVYERIRKAGDETLFIAEVKE